MTHRKFPVSDSPGERRFHYVDPAGSALFRIDSQQQSPNIALEIHGTKSRVTTRSQRAAFFVLGLSWMSALGVVTGSIQAARWSAISTICSVAFVAMTP